MEFYKLLIDVLRNPMEAQDPAHLEIKFRILEELYHFRGTKRFIIEEEDAQVKAIFEKVYESVPPVFRGVPDNVKIAKPLMGIYVPRNGRVIMLSSQTYEPYEIVMPIFGTLKKAEDIVLHGMVIKTVMGLVVTCDPYSNSWRFVRLSCKPNVEIMERAVLHEDGSKSFSLNFMAIKHIERGEDFRACRNNLHKTTGDYDCDCGVVGCIGNRKTRYTCLDEGCHRYNIPYSDQGAYLEHMKKHEMQEDEERVPEPRVECTHEGCTQDFASKKIMQRHFRNKHGKGKKHKCPHCRYKYTTKDGFNRHIFKNKKGCRALQEAQMKLKSTELGLRTKLVQQGRKCDGFVMVEVDRAATPEEQAESPETVQQEQEAPAARRSNRLTTSTTAAPKKQPTQSKIAKPQSKIPEKTVAAKGKAKPSASQSAQNEPQPSTSATVRPRPLRTRPVTSAASVQPQSSRIPRAVPSTTASLPPTLPQVPPPQRSTRLLRPRTRGSNFSLASTSTTASRRNQSALASVEEEAETQQQEKKGKKKVTKKPTKDNLDKGNKKPEDKDPNGNGRGYGLRPRK